MSRRALRSLSSSSLSDNAVRTLSSIASSASPLTSTRVTLAAIAGDMARQQARARSSRVGDGVIGAGYRCGVKGGLISGVAHNWRGCPSSSKGMALLLVIPAKAGIQ